MKKFVCTLIAASLLAMPTQAAQSNSMEIMRMIDQGLEMNDKQIATASNSLSESDRLTIFTAKKKEPLLPFVLNLILGLGIGSFALGDNQGGGIELIGEIGGIALVGLGSAMKANDAQSVTTVSAGPTVIIVGGILVAGFRLFGLTRPFFFAGSYNDKLQTVLGGHTVSFDPYLDQRGLGVGVMF